MKKRFAFLLALCLALLLCACSASTSPMHFVHKNGVQYEVNTEARTISDGMYTYNYTFSEGNDSYTITVTYPNGSRYSLSQSGSWGSGSGSKDYSPALYADGEILCDILADIHVNAQSSTVFSGRKFFLVLFLGGAGIFLVVSPRTAWYLSRGWYYKNAEPSDAALVWTCINGALFILLAIIAVFMPI